MNRKLKRVLQCPICKNKLNVALSTKDAGIYSCICSEYPYVLGILYLKKDTLGRKAALQIRSGNDHEAALTLIGSGFLFSIPIRLILLRNHFNRLFFKLFKKDIKDVIGFNNFIKLLSLFGYPKAWARYLLKRPTHTGYKLAVFSASIVPNKNSIVLDFGCGTGHLVPILLKTISAGNIYALDNSFFNLVLAKSFFSKGNPNFICTDATYILPFLTKSFDLIIASDSLHNLKKKDLFLNEASRTLKANGLFYIIHTVHFSGKAYENIWGVKAAGMHQMLKQRKFKKVSIFKNEELLSILETGKPFRLNGSLRKLKIKNKEGYSLFAAKKSFPLFKSSKFWQNYQ